MRRLESARKQERHTDIRSEPESVGKAAAPIFGEFVVVASAIAAGEIMVELSNAAIQPREAGCRHPRTVRSAPLQPLGISYACATPLELHKALNPR